MRSRRVMVDEVQVKSQVAFRLSSFVHNAEVGAEADPSPTNADPALPASSSLKFRHASMSTIRARCPAVGDAGTPSPAPADLQRAPPIASARPTWPV